MFFFLTSLIPVGICPRSSLEKLLIYPLILFVLLSILIIIAQRYMRYDSITANKKLFRLNKSISIVTSSPERLERQLHLVVEVN